MEPAGGLCQQFVGLFKSSKLLILLISVSRQTEACS
jgi:hypothetical protein